MNMREEEVMKSVERFQDIYTSSSSSIPTPPSFSSETYIPRENNSINEEYEQRRRRLEAYQDTYSVRPRQPSSRRRPSANRGLKYDVMDDYDRQYRRYYNDERSQNEVYDKVQSDDEEEQNYYPRSRLEQYQDTYSVKQSPSQSSSSLPYSSSKSAYLDPYQDRSGTTPQTLSSMRNRSRKYEDDDYYNSMEDYNIQYERYYPSNRDRREIYSNNQEEQDTASYEKRSSPFDYNPASSTYRNQRRDSRERSNPTRRDNDEFFSTEFEQEIISSSSNRDDRYDVMDDYDRQYRRYNDQYENDEYDSDRDRERDDDGDEIMDVVGRRDTLTYYESNHDLYDDDDDDAEDEDDDDNDDDCMRNDDRFDGASRFDSPRDVDGDSRYGPTPRARLSAIATAEDERYTNTDSRRRRARIPREKIGSYMMADEPYESSTSYSQCIPPSPFQTIQSFAPISMYGPARNNYWRISLPNTNRYYRPIDYGFNAPPPPHAPFNYYIDYNLNRNDYYEDSNEYDEFL